ncbi:MAG TPA: hypothetical protein VJN70_09320 [Gemmatimonadaceae bacterium]|nr:hypothetical protein [Gemmatimonadaceae bacterium]
MEASHLAAFGHQLRFGAASSRAFGWKIRDVDSTLTFELTSKDIRSVEPFAFPSPFARLFDLPFTRVQDDEGRCRE